ncbi:MAG: transcriptional regulator PpsR [Rhizobiaceae bacterium]|nr:transcriptional regulator PpsR [Rhizobiaceae bacterium]
MDDRAGSTSEMSFLDGESHFGNLESSQIVSILGASSDVVLVVGKDGEIKDASFRSQDLFAIGGRSWVGRNIHDVVTIESEPKVREMLEDLNASSTGASREINHVMLDGDDTPVSYQAIQLNKDGDALFFGQDISRIAALQRRLMSSQLAMEREVARLRNAENQYRAVFQLNKTPQFVIEVDTLRIFDVNTAAARLLGEPLNRIAGKKIQSIFREKDSSVLHKFLMSAINASEASQTDVQLITGETLDVSVSNFSQDGKNYLFLTLLPRGGDVDNLPSATERKVLSLVEQMPDAFVLTDENRIIYTANTAFCELVNVAGPSAVEGRTLDTFFERPSVDCNVLLANVRKHGVVRRFASSIRTQFGQGVNVEIAASQLEVSSEMVLGFWLRPTQNLVMGAEVEQENVSRTNEQIANLVGHMPLKDIVRQTTDMIEKLCIETALDLTQNNRASAAQMLGVSRQSLYSKLGRDGTKDRG